MCDVSSDSVRSYSESVRKGILVVKNDSGLICANVCQSDPM